MVAASELGPVEGERVALVPLHEGHVPELRRILATPAVRARWGEEPSPWPDDDPGTTRFAVTAW